MIDTIFVPSGPEAAAVRRALDLARSQVAVIETGIGPHAARLAVETALAGPTMTNVLTTGLCGLLSPAFAVGDAVVYGEIVEPDGASAGAFTLDPTLADAVAARIPTVQTGIRALAARDVVIRAREKFRLGAEYGAQAVDLESLEIARGLGAVGIAVAVVRVGSDGVFDDLPDLHMARDGSGGLDAFALALAMLRRPLAGLRLARNGTRALSALEATVARITAR